MTSYQREVVALIRASGARLTILHDHRLVDLWREYSQRTYCCGWIKGDRQEIYRFVTWSNNLRGISREIQWANRVEAHGSRGVRLRLRPVAAWDARPMAAERLGP